MSATKRPLKLSPILQRSPQRVYHFSDDVYHLRDDDLGFRIALVYERDHAAQIIKTVNNFEGMLEALKLVRLADVHAIARDAIRAAIAKTEED